jgi:hypothetical protein
VPSLSGEVEMRTNFPARVFGEADVHQTLRDLGLAPSATIFIKVRARLTEGDGLQPWFLISCSARRGHC